MNKPCRNPRNFVNLGWITVNSLYRMGLFVNIAKNLLFGREIPSAEQVSYVGPSSATTGLTQNYLDWISSNKPALCVGAVYRCVELLSTSVAQLPLGYYKLRNGIFVEDTESQLHYFLSVQPDEAYSAFDFWKQVVYYVLMFGNAYIVPMYASDPKDGFTRLALCNPMAVSHDVDHDTYTIQDYTNAVSGTYSESEVIHIKGLSRDGKTGLSVMAFARTATDIAVAGDNETLNRFRTGGNVRGIVSNDKSVHGFGSYADKQMGKTATNLDELFNVKGQHIVSLAGDVDFKQLSMTSADMQFLESRKLTVRDICRFFGVHPSFVFDDTSNNYKSAEMANVAFLANTLNPLLRRIEQELLRKLVSPSLCTKRKFEFDRKGLYACDLESKVRYDTQRLAAGVCTVNELRKEANKPQVDGGDEIFISANLRSLSESTIPTNNNTQEDGQGKTTQA